MFHFPGCLLIKEEEDPASSGGQVGISQDCGCYASVGEGMKQEEQALEWAAHSQSDPIPQCCVTLGKSLHVWALVR